MNKPVKRKIRLPYNFEPRHYQLPILRKFDDGFKRFCIVAHRRFGKDKMCMNIVAKEMFKRIGSYYYILPTYAQGKKVIWNGRDRDGFKFTDHIPKELRIRTNNSDMLIETIKPPHLMREDEKQRMAQGEKIPGSIFQVVGSDNIDSIVGTNPIGVVFSEWALQDPSAWDYIRPILAENGGWAIFIYTARGKNHGWTTKQIALKFPEVWAHFDLKVSDTKAIDDAILFQERMEIIEKDGNDDLYMQEYENDFGVAIKGAYYGDLFRRIDTERRITSVPYDPNTLVHTAWDLGVDTMKVWCIQRVGKEFHAIDYLEGVKGGIRGFIKELKKKEYQYGRHFVPHDAQGRETSSGKTRVEVANELGFEFEVVPNIGVDNGIEAVKGVLGRFWFDQTKCGNGVSALRSYKHDYDEKTKTYKKHPAHDWASHGADAFRYFAVGYTEEDDLPQERRPHQQAETYEIEFDPYD